MTCFCLGCLTSRHIGLKHTTGASSQESIQQLTRNMLQKLSLNYFFVFLLLVYQWRKYHFILLDFLYFIDDLWCLLKQKISIIRSWSIINLEKYLSNLHYWNTNQFNKYQKNDARLKRIFHRFKQVYVNVLYHSWVRWK